MGLWKITDNGPAKVAETGLKQEKLLEQNLEDWIEKDPSILGEQILVIGRQVRIPDTQDRIDLLGLDPQGSAVIIELKRGKLKDPADIQALRYASYVSRWEFEDFENVARNYQGAIGSEDFNFNSLFEDFCESSGVEDVPDINEEQRVIIAGSSVKDKLGSVALWLRDHNVDIRLIEIRAFKNGDELLLEPHVIVPTPVGRFKQVGGKAGSNPWLLDGQKWHLDKRCSPRTREMLLKLDKLIQENVEVDGPGWGQKHYIAYRVNNFNWLCVNTSPSALTLDLCVKPGSFESRQLAERLGIVEFDKEVSLSEKLGLPTSVLVRSVRDTMDRIRIRAKDDGLFGSAEFLLFLQEAHAACAK